MKGQDKKNTPFAPLSFTRFPVLAVRLNPPTLHLMSDRSQETITLLGRSESRLPASPDAATLETFTNRNPQRNYTISLESSGAVESL